MPCFKLGIKFGRTDILRRFLASGRTGFYFSVKREGVVEAGDAIQLIGRDPNDVTVADITRLYSSDNSDVELLRASHRARGAARKLARPVSANNWLILTDPSCLNSITTDLRDGVVFATAQIWFPQASVELPALSESSSTRV